MSVPVIRLAEAADLAEIIRIYNASIPGRLSTADLEPVTVAERAQWFVEHLPSRRPIWVAVRGGEVVGWLSFSDYKARAAYETTVEVGVYVAPAAHRSGVGQALLRHAVAAAPGLGIRTFLWVTFTANAAGMRLAEAFGFEQWGLLPGVTELDGIRRDISILGLELTGSAGAGD